MLAYFFVCFFFPFIFFFLPLVSSNNCLQSCNIWKSIFRGEPFQKCFCHSSILVPLILLISFFNYFLFLLIQKILSRFSKVIEYLKMQASARIFHSLNIVRYLSPANFSTLKTREVVPYKCYPLLQVPKCV